MGQSQTNFFLSLKRVLLNFQNFWDFFSFLLSVTPLRKGPIFICMTLGHEKKGTLVHQESKAQKTKNISLFYKKKFNISCSIGEISHHYLFL